MRDYRKIETWQLADDLAVDVYNITKNFPKEELYGITSQLRRASSSVPANIAEGSARETQKDYLRFLHIARGSLSETQYFLHLSKRLELLTPEKETEVQAQVVETFRKLHGLISYMKKESS